MDDRPDRRAARAVIGWLSAGLLAAVAIGCVEGEGVPGPLLGRWTSSDPRYAGRSVAISQATLEFGIDPLTSERFLIERVESERAHDGTTLHAIYYRDAEGSTRTVRLHLLPTGRPTLRFENHSELWVRAGDTTGLTRGG